ncbi:MAG TPA: hypothetical protein VGJ62_07280 [Gemmatimonadaceae bacterium]|jgi:hypothetical protein
MSIQHLYLFAVAAVLGCSSATSSNQATAGLPRKANLLTAEEIAAAHADVNTAYDAVARLRPNWLAPHGVTSGMNNGAGTEYALVFVDGQPYGDLNSLRGIPAYHVGNLRYYDVTQAGARFGIRAGSSGVIEVTMMSPR